MNDIHGRGTGAVNLANGALTELAKRGGAGWAQSAQAGGAANKAGHQLVKQASKLAPGAVAAAGVAVAAAPAVAVAAGAVALGVGAIFAGKWIAKQFK
jgi:hypothetical protein